MLIDFIQWPAMVATVMAAWLVGSSKKHRRGMGFWLFLVSNVLWVVWGFHARAYALIVLQVCLALLNFRGVHTNDAAPTLKNEPAASN